MRAGGMARRRLAVSLAAILILAALATIPFWTAPTSNTTHAQLDAIIVLGHPAVNATTPDPDGQARMREGVNEFRRHVAPVIIVTGGAAHNRFVEAHALAAYAESLGVPASDIIEEGHARNTVENIYFSFQLMQAHNWHSAEVISEPSHLPRTAYILKHFPLEWRVHASEWPPEMSKAMIALRYCEEFAKLDLRLLGLPPTHYLH
jgi:uncharacterized SAM-binding protein YcdF (DUF218 family)